jgi:hypothetical protein
VFHPHHGHGTVTAVHGNHVTVTFDKGPSRAFPVRSHPGPGHFERMTDDEVAEEYSKGKGSRAAAALDEMDRRDRADRDAKSKRVAALYAEKPKSEADRNRVYQGLVNEGEDPEEAWAHAHGASADDMQKQAVMQQLRAEGHKGAGFDALTRSAYKDEVRRRIGAAEAATNGYMLSPQGKRAKIDPYSLFTGPESRARKYASPELKEWFDQNGRPTAADFQANLLGKPVSAGPRGGDFYASVTWDDLASVIELSARTAMLEHTPAPRGKPGGPGLYDVKGMGHTSYEQQIVKALIEKRGMPPGKAYAIARASIRRWMIKSKHPEVKAAAARAEAGEVAKQERAKAIHGHATTWDGLAVELATVLDFYNPAGNPNQPRDASGKFTEGQPDAHQKHVAHLQHLATHGTPAQRKAAQSALARMKAGGSKNTAAKAKAKATASQTASVTAKADAHKKHLAHVAHLQHLATHGTPAQQKAAASALARLGVKA